MLELVEQTEVAIDEVIQVMGRATIEAVLEMSAEGVAGVKQDHERKTTRCGMAGRVVWFTCTGRCVWSGHGSGAPVGWRGRGAGVRSDAETGRRGRSDARGPDGGGEPRKYGRVIGEMADTVGVSVMRRSRPRSMLKELIAPAGCVGPPGDLPGRDPDGLAPVLAAVGVDSDGKKHVLGVREGASENAEVTSALLEDWSSAAWTRAGGGCRDDGRKRSGRRSRRCSATSPHSAPATTSSATCLPSSGHRCVKAAFRAAKLAAGGKLEQLAMAPGAKASPGYEPARPRRNQPIDSTHSGVRQKTRRVTNWKNGAMALRWAAASFVETEKSYRRIIGQLWMLGRP